MITRKELPKKKYVNRFTKEEDELLIKAVHEMGNDHWDLISKKLPNRTVRQCRDRYRLYLSSNVNDFPWTSEEDQLLLNLVQKYGKVWPKISSYFKPKSASDVRHRYEILSQRQTNLAAALIFNPQNPSKEIQPSETFSMDNF